MTVVGATIKVRPQDWISLCKFLAQWEGWLQPASLLSKLGWPALQEVVRMSSYHMYAHWGPSCHLAISGHWSNVQQKHSSCKDDGVASIEETRLTHTQNSVLAPSAWVNGNINFNTQFWDCNCLLSKDTPISKCSSNSSKRACWQSTKLISGLVGWPVQGDVFKQKNSNTLIYLYIHIVWQCCDHFHTCGENCLEWELSHHGFLPQGLCLHAKDPQSSKDKQQTCDH